MPACGKSQVQIRHGGVKRRVPGCACRYREGRSRHADLPQRDPSTFPKALWGPRDRSVVERAVSDSSPRPSVNPRRNALPLAEIRPSFFEKPGRLANRITHDRRTLRRRQPGPANNRRAELIINKGAGSGVTSTWAEADTVPSVTKEPGSKLGSLGSSEKTS